MINKEEIEAIALYPVEKAMRNWFERRAGHYFDMINDFVHTDESKEELKERFYAYIKLHEGAKVELNQHNETGTFTHDTE